MAEKPKQLGDYDVALKMRDILGALVTQELEKQRPRGKQAVVVDWDRDNLKAEVRFPGDTQTVQASFPKNLQPKRRTMDDGIGNAQGDIVTVEGRPGSYRITTIGDGSARSEEQTLLNPFIITMQGIEEALLGMLPQPGDLRYTLRDVPGGGAVLPGNWVLLDNSLVTRSSPFDQAWQNLGSPTNGTDGTNWRLDDGRDRAPWGVGDTVTLRGDEGQSLANRGPYHEHSVPAGGSHSHSHNHTHNISSGGSHAHTDNPGTVGKADGGGTAAGPNHGHGSAGGHDHGGNTGLPGDPTTGTQSDHDHTGSTGTGTTATNRIGWKGVNWLMKL